MEQIQLEIGTYRDGDIYRDGDTERQEHIEMEIETGTYE